MKVITLAFITAVAAAPAAMPEPQFDLTALLGSLGGAGGAPGAAGAAGGADGLAGLAALIPPGLDIGALASQFLGGGASSGPEGDASVIIAGYNDIKDKANAMDAVVSAYNNGTNVNKELPTLQKLSKDLRGALEGATKNIEAMVGPIGIMGATGLQAPGAEVTDATKLSIAHLIEKKGIFIGEARKAEIEHLKSLLEATEKFNAAVNAKLPSFVQGIAAPMAQQSVDALKDGIAAFS